MAVTATRTVGGVCLTALRRAKITAWGESAAPEDMDEAITELQHMLKAWQERDFLWVRDSYSLALASDTASYALASPARPLAILSARYKDANGYEMPMEELTRDEYDALPLKSVNGIPTTFYYDRGREQGTFYTWPVLKVRTTETVEMTIKAEIEDVALTSDVLDVPAEWYDACVWNLAARLSHQPDARLIGRADDALEKAVAAAMTESLFVVQPE